MDVNDNAGHLIPRGVLTTIASNRASTGCSYSGQCPLATDVNSQEYRDQIPARSTLSGSASPRSTQAATVSISSSSSYPCAASHCGS